MRKYLSKTTQFSKTSSARLALSYLVIIMFMSIVFSYVFYGTSSHEVGRRVDLPASITQTFPQDQDHPDSNRNPAVDAFFRQRAMEVRHALLIRLIVINLLVLAGGSLLSYYLARRTLSPIESNMEAQTQFVSDASHELRTPLTALQTTNEVALRKTKVSSAEAKTIFEQNVEEVMKLRQLTDSLLKLAKNDNGKLSLQPAELSDVVSEALNTVINEASAKDMAIEDDVPRISVLADKPSLVQAIVTILDNAVKYSPPKSTIHINATQQGKFAVLNIKDEGVGIKAVHLPHIFDRFYRADDSRNKLHHDGYGIGLSLAKKIIEQHNGQLTVESTPNKGSTFTIKLPLS